MKRFFILALIAVLVMSISGISMVTAQATGCPEGLFPMMSAELEAACKGEYAGTFVSMTGPFVTADQVKFEQSIADFEQWTGIDLQYTGTKQFEVIIRAAVEGGAAPDIADFPQPGLLKSFVDGGYVQDVSTFLNADWLAQNYLQSWTDMASIDGITAGVWNRYNAKSIVWYPKAAFDAAGYTVPTTWDELLALSDQIVADGSTPWCIGIGSGAATGWPLTDWIEDVMLRTTSLENYDNWSFPADPANRLLFSSPEVKNAAETVGSIWFKDNYVYGGREAIASTGFDAAPLPMFNDPPDCYLHRQANFITSFFPSDKVYGTDYDFFYLPPIDDMYGRPFLVAGDIYSMFNDRPEVRAFMDFFSRGESVKAWVGSGGALSPHNDTPFDWYGSPVERKLAEMVGQATAVRFDGSDLMPGAVGAGTFWTSMTNWVAGTVDLDTALSEIDASWPSS